jgi:hypothetical protein
LEETIMQQNLWQTNGPRLAMATASPNLRASPILLAAMLAMLSLACSNNAAKTPPQRPSANANGGIQESASPTKGTGRGSTSRDSRTKDDDNKDPEDPDEVPRRSPRTPTPAPSSPIGTPPRTTKPANPPIDPMLARMTCDAPPIRGDAIKLIEYLNNSNPPGGDRLTPEQRASALESVKGTDVKDPESVKIIQDQLDAACKKP